MHLMSHAKPLRTQRFYPSVVYLHRRFCCCVAVSIFLIGSVFGESIRLATYNLNNYLVTDRHVNGTWRPSYPKPEAEKAVVRRVIRQVLPDILVVQEIGTLPFLKELKADLELENIEYPYTIHMEGSDPVRHMAVLTKLEPVEVVRHQNLNFTYRGKRELVKRGMLELSFEQMDGAVFKLFVVHLKSRRTNIKADPESLQCRTLEAEACRDRIIERTFKMDITDFIVAGDFNDHPASAPLRRFYKRGKQKLGDLVFATDSRGERWTHYYRKEATYSLVDGFIVSQSLSPKIKDNKGYIVDGPDVLEGSDHRMVYVDLLVH